jgi:hypothetical protein
MKIIGNIVSDRIITHDDRIKTVGSIDEIIDGLPTLIIGWEKVKSINPEVDILEKHINLDLFWTYALTEKRSEHDVDIQLFIQYCYDNLVEDIEYIFIDPIQFKLNTIKKTIKKIRSFENPICYHNDRVIYIYGEDIIFGIDLLLCDTFFSIRPEKIKRKIETLTNSLLLDENILIEYKDYLERLDDIKYIPYLYHIENE